MYWSMNSCTHDDGQRWIDDIDYVDGLEWWKGLPIRRDLLPKSYVVTLKRIRTDSDDHGHFMPPFFNLNPPIMSAALVEALEAEGVGNLEHFPVEIHDPMNGSIRHDYRAVNLLGLIYAADLAKSTYTASPGGPRVDVEFDHLVLDGSQPVRELMFRLGESVDVILVHDRLKRSLERKGFTSIVFYNPGEIAT